jgi:N utilization substance protein A
VEALADMTPEQLEAIEGIGPKTVEKISIAVNNYFSGLESGEAAAAPAEGELQTEEVPEAPAEENAATEEQAETLSAVEGAAEEAEAPEPAIEEPEAGTESETPGSSDEQS